MSNKAYAQYSISDIRDGKDGVGILELEEQYYKSTSNSSQTGGNWSSTQPTWEDGYYIWTRLKITWDNDVSDPEHITYTDPVLATTYQSLHTDVINRINNIATKDENGNWSLTNGVIENTYVYSSEDGDPIALGEIGANITTTKDQILSTVSSTYATTANLNSEANKRKATYVTCSTGVGTKAKIGSCSNFELYNGATITCVFSNANTQAAPTLNVNGTGAKTIVSYDGKALTESEYKWKAGSAYTLVYDGTYWRMQDSGTVARLTTAESSIQQNADNIELKVSESDVTGNYLIGKINLNSTTATISADRVNITGDVIVSKLSDANKNAISANAISKAEAAIVEQKTLYYLTNGNAPAKPTKISDVSTTSTSTGVWTTVIPTPKNGYTYYTCTQTKNGAGTYAWIGDSNNKGIKMATDSMIANWCSASDSTYINGGSIYANSITTNQLATDAIKSINYQSASGANSPYSSSGSFFDLSNGNIYTPNFGVQSTTGKAYLNGEIVATSGTIGDDSGNYWSIGNTTDSNSNTYASIVGNGTAYIQDGDFQIHNGASNYSKGSINTQWYATVSGGLKITYPFYANTYYDFGMTSPVLDTTDTSRFYNETVSQNFLYIRKHESTIPTLASDWNYVFRVDKDGNAYVNNLYVNGTSIATMISDGVDGGAYLPTSGGTVSGNVTITGTLTATASKAIGDKNGSDITTTYHKLAGSNTNTATNTFSGTNTFSKTGGFTYSGIENANSAGNRPVWFSYLGTTGRPVYNNNFQYNPSTNVLTVGSITGNAATATSATKAMQDASGNVITETYAKINDTLLTGTTIAESINSDEIITGSLIVNGDARFVNTINGDISGNAATATSSTSANSLSSSGTIKVNLASTTASTYTSGGNITPGVSGTLPVGNGGTGKSSWTQYGILYASASNTLAQLGVGTSGQVLTSKGSATPEWTDQSSLSVGSATKDGSGNTISSYYAPKSTAVTNVAYDSTNKKITKTINGTTSDIVTITTLKSAMELNNVTNNKQVKGLSSGTTSGHLVTWGSDGYTVADSGIALAPSGNTRGIVSGVASNSSGQLVLTYADGSTSSGIDVEFVATQTSSVQKAEALNVNGTAVGSATIPVYFNAQGKPQTANTIPKLNNTTTGGAFYAPTSTGSSGQVITYPSSGSVPVWTNQSSLSVGSATKATQDGNGKNINDTYLKKATDTMTGTLIIKPSTTIATNTPATIEFQITQTDNNITTNGNFIKVYDDHDANNYGGNMVIQAASGVVIGAGESPTAFYTNVMKDSTTEKLTLVSDGSIEILTNANTFANRKGITLNTSLNLYPQTTNTGSVGTSDNKWNAMYATTFYGALDGNATTATTAGNVTGTVAVGNGGTGKTSWTQWGIVYASATNALSQVSAGTSGQVLTSKGSAAPAWTNQSALSVGSATKATNDSDNNPINTTYLKLDGGTMTGLLNFTTNAQAISFRPGSTSYDSGFVYGTDGNECLALVQQNQITSFMVVHGSDPASWGSGTWKSSTPTIQTKYKSLYVNELIANGVTPEFNFKVNGTSYLGGNVKISHNNSDTEGAVLSYNSTNKCIDFIFN